MNPPKKTPPPVLRRHDRTPRPIPGEVWVPVKGYEYRYDVSNKGRIRQRCDAFGNPKPDDAQLMVSRATRNINGGHNFARVRLVAKDNEYAQAFRVAELVLRAFVSDPPNDWETHAIYFRDGNKNNCDARNLAWRVDVLDELQEAKRRAKRDEQERLERVYQQGLEVRREYGRAYVEARQAGPEALEAFERRSQMSLADTLQELEQQNRTRAQPVQRPYLAPVAPTTGINEPEPANATPVASAAEPTPTEDAQEAPQTLVQATHGLDADWDDIIADPPFLRPEWFNECVAAGVLAPDKYRAMREDAGLPRNAQFEAKLRRMLS